MQIVVNNFFIINSYEMDIYRIVQALSYLKINIHIIASTYLATSYR
ncbi:MAG: hypothetical protein Tsb002_10640 [Wenzhouxiangellaceae bacterium]